MADTYETVDARLGIYNFYRNEDLQAFLGILHETSPPALIVLETDSGFGVSDFLWTAVHTSRRQERPLDLLDLDLDASEMDRHAGLVSFLGYQLEKRGKADDEHVAQLGQVARSLTKLGIASGTWHVLFALGLALKLENLVWFLRKLAAGDGGPAPVVEPRELLGSFLKQVSTDSPLIVHVRDLPSLADDVWRWLVEIVEREPGRLFLTVGEKPDRYTRKEPRLVALEPLERHELQAKLDQRLHPNELPWELTDALMRSTRGRPARVAAKVRKMVHDGVLVEDLSGVWHFPENPAKRLADAFEEDLYEPISQRLSELEGRRREVEEWIFLAALCGECVPAELLLDHLGVEGEDRDGLIDWVDDHLVEEMGILADHQLLHPSFPGLFVYRFFNPIIRDVILEQRSEVEREGIAAVLWPFLRERLPVATRGIARVFLALCEHLSQRDQKTYRRQLTWWVSQEDLDGFTQRLREEVRSGDLEDPELLWSVYLASKGFWSYRRSLALLDAYAEQEAGIPWDRLGRYQFERATVLRVLGHLNKALEAAREAIRLFSGSSEAQPRAVTWGIVADILQARGELDEALRILQDDVLPVFSHLGLPSEIDWIRRKIDEITSKRDGTTEDE